MARIQSTAGPAPKRTQAVNVTNANTHRRKCSEHVFVKHRREGAGDCSLGPDGKCSVGRGRSGSERCGEGSHLTRLPVAGVGSMWCGRSVARSGYPDGGAGRANMSTACALGLYILISASGSTLTGNQDEYTSYCRARPGLWPGERLLPGAGIAAQARTHVLFVGIIRAG